MDTFEHDNQQIPLDVESETITAHSLKPNESQDSGSALELIFGGFALPSFSPTFYYRAVQHGFWPALGFFFIFAFILIILQSISLSQTIATFRVDIDDAFASGLIPEVTITNGRTQLHAPQPLVIIDDPAEGLFVIDTSGVYDVGTVDPNKYENILILTDDTVIRGERGQFDVTNLSDINAVFGDPIVVDADAAKQMMGWLQLFGVIGITLWQTVIRLIFITALALFVWLITMIFQRDVSYVSVFVVGIYALVPAVYINYLFDQISLSFCSSQTLILLAFWAFGLAMALPLRKGDLLAGQRTLRGWRTLIALPLLLALILHAIISFSFGPAILWGLAIITLLALITVSYLQTEHGQATL